MYIHVARLLLTGKPFGHQFLADGLLAQKCGYFVMYICLIGGKLNRFYS